MHKPRILLLTLEYPRWVDAGKYSYESNFGFEEGFAASGHEHVTVPLMYFHPGSPWQNWFNSVYHALRGQRFDQVWFETVHMNYPDGFLDFIHELAPVRVGFYGESSEWHPLEMSTNPTGTQQRQVNIEKNLPHATHLIAVDEKDVARFNADGKIPAFWWASGFIPERFVAAEPKFNAGGPGIFHGTLYGTRKEWFEHPALKGLLRQGATLEAESPWPKEYDAINASVEEALANDVLLEGSVFAGYIDALRQTRRACYPLWFESLRKGGAVVNLPQFAKAYASRVTQGLAAGCPVITWEIPDRPRTKALYVEDQEILLFNPEQPEGLAEQIERLQRDPDFARQLAANGLAKMRRFHTIEKFAADVQHWIETGEQPNYGEGELASGVSILSSASKSKNALLTEIESKQLWRSGQPLRLHLGCGEQHFDGYINIDYPPSEHSVMKIQADVFANILTLELPDRAVDEIRLHHVFEHFNRVTALAMLIKWQRALKIGGVLRIETPDIMGCARTLLSDAPMRVKMGLIRHLAGDQADSWAYHLDHWFPERYVHTLKTLGFDQVQTQSRSWAEPPYLSNVEVLAIKTSDWPEPELLKRADALLTESTVSPVEEPTWQVWRRQLREQLARTEARLPVNVAIAHAKPDGTPPQKSETSADAVVASNSAPVPQPMSGKDLFLGLKLYGHDAAVFSIFPDERDVFGLTEERLTRFKHDDLFPLDAIRRMIEYKKIDPSGVRNVYAGSAFTCQKDEKYPARFFELTQAKRRFFKAKYTKDYEKAVAEFQALPVEEQQRRLQQDPAGREIIEHLRHQEVQSLDQQFRIYLQEIFPNAVIHLNYHDHEYCHAISAYYSSGFEEALVVAFDGYGDENTFSRVYAARRGQLTERGVCRSSIRELRVAPDVVHECSIGGIYSWFTRFLGFRPDSDEGKVEALAAYGDWNNPLYADLMSLVQVSMEQGIVIDHARATQLLARDRLIELQKTISKANFAAAIQKFAEDVVLGYLRLFVEKTGLRKICLSGGVTANVIINLKIYKELAEEIFIVPAMADDGSAQGAAILEWVSRGGTFEASEWFRSLPMPYWGTSWTRDEVGRRLRAFNRAHEDVLEITDMPESWPETAAELICNGEIGAIFHGRMEWGPRALGNRSIIADARDPHVRDRLNRDIKNRPHFQPFCPSMLAEEQARLFDRSYLNKHMTIAFDLKKEFWAALPGAIHIDGTSRVQFVTAEDNPNYHRLIARVKELTGFGVIINTSFNKHGRTIVESPEDALQDFLDSQLEFLMVEGFLVRKAPKARVVGIVFSKDRPLQLDATLRSLKAHCRDAAGLPLKVLYKTSGGRQASLYRQVQAEHPEIEFVPERDFKRDLLRLAHRAEHVLFLVDDNLFLRDFSIEELVTELNAHRDALGFSLRLGRNTTYCYSLNRLQALPAFQEVNTGALQFRWVEAECDFGYPLELSSSLYRCADLLPLLRDLDYRNPNTLEGVLADQAQRFREHRPSLLCPAASLTFCAPINRVQNLCPNRAGTRNDYAPEMLAAAYAKGERIDVPAYAGFTPAACHEEVELKFISTPGGVPKVSVIIPCYNQANYLPETIESVVGQTFTDWEIVVVNDGSKDNTSAVTRELAARFPQHVIRLVEKPNGGLSDARNAGIRAARGEYILPLDSDDLLAPEFLEKTARLLEARADVAIAYTDVQQFGHRNDLWITHDGEPSAVLSNTRHAYCALYRREVWEAVGGYNTNMIWGYEDWDFWVGCFERGFKEAKVAEPLLRYRTKAESMYTRALEHDTELKAQIVLNHPAVYNAETRAWAEGVMAKAAAEARNGSQPSDPIHSALHAATIYFNKGDLTAAREALLQAQSLAPESPEIAEALGSVSFQLGDFSAAQVHFLKAAALAPENPDHQVKLALTALRLEQIDRFESALGRALALDPQHRDALKLLADLNFQAAHWRDAEAGFTTLLSQTPDDQELLLQLAVCQFRQDKFDAAHHSLRRVLLLNPEHRLALENLQVVQSRLACDAVNGSGQVPSAIAACENSAQNNGHYGTAQGPEISVVLPTYNRPEILARCLEGFAKQTIAREQFEIVIVDDGSNPPVQSTVDRFAGALLITYHFQANGGLAAARNACIERARAPLLALHDDDDVPAPDYLERCLEFHRAHPAEADILLARVAPHPDLEKTPLLEWIFDIENGIIGFPAPGVVHGFDKFFGGTSSCKKSIFSHGLYNPEYRFGYEDMELAFRLNQKLPLRVQYDSAVVSYLIREPDFAGLFRRSYREGRSFRRFFQHHGEAAFGLLPGDMNHSTEVVQVIGSKVSAILNLMQQIGCDGANTGVPLTIGHETFRGAEALKVCFSLCVKFARAQGWVDFAQGVDESAGLHRINACLDPQSIAKSARSQAAALPAKAAPAPGKKRALIYFHCNPYPPRSGAHRRAWNTMQGLLALGYEITLVSSDLFTDQPWTDDAVFGLRRDHGIEARVYFGSDEDREYIQNCGGSVWRVHTPPGLVQFFRNAFREISPELVLVNYAYCSEFVAAPEFAQSTCLIEMHDLVSLSQQMAQAAWAQLNGKIKPEFLDDAFFARLGLKADPEEYRRYDAVHGVICISSTETELVRTHAPNTAASYLPLAFEPKFVANSYSKGPILAIFTNAFNLQGYLWFTEKVLPQLLPAAKNFSLRIVGDACKVLPARPGTELLGFVPELSQTYAESKYAICPLLGGTGQQVKIVEAMAHGLAVVAHKNVAASSPIEHGVNGFIAENAAQFTACVLKLERDPALCRKMGEAARRTIAEKFSQENYTKSLAQAIALANGKKSSTLTPQPSAVASAEIRKDRHEPSMPIEAQSSIAPRSQLPVRWLAPFFNPSGYASEAINFVVPLAKRVQLGIQHNNRIYSEKFVAGLAEEERATLLALRDHFANLKGGIVISHTPAEGFQRLPDAQYNIGRTMFEVDRISPHWVSLCNQMDEIWVPSQFNLETFAASGVERDKLVVIPEAVNELEFNPEVVTPLPLPNRARFNFLSIFEWSSRKGWDVLLAAYLAEFSADDDVCLYLRTYLVNQPDGDPAEILWRRIRDFAATLNLGDKSWPRIELLAEQIPAADLPRLYKAVDCLVAPSRGEGWGRPHHEAMMMALPVIATRWSGTTEFLSGETAYLLDYTLAEAKGLEPELGHYRGFKWAEPSIGHLRQLMRQVRMHPEEARAKGQAARQHVLKHFSREPVADRIAERLQAIQTKLVTPSLPAVVAKPVLAPVEFPETKPQSVQVAWEGSFLDFGSLSLVNRELTRQLGRQPHLHVVCVGKNGIAPEHAEDRELQEMARRLRFEAPAKTQVTIRHAWPPNWQQPKQGAWIQMQPWEFGRLPKEWVAESGRVHEFWVYSEYVRRVYVDSGVDPSKVKVVPLGIDPARFHPEVPPLNLPSKKSFKFLFVGGTIGRKGTDVLLDTYLKQFTASDDVCLVIKDFGGRTVYNGQTLEAQIRASQTRPDAPEILYLNEELSTDQLPALYTACHCLVHPYRGEGFGLPVLEAMACGLPVIVTGGGSTDDFATDEYAFRIPAVRKPIGTRVSEFELNGNGWLLEPCREALSKQLRWCFTHREEARIRGQAASAYVRQHWTWERSAQIASQRLQNLIARIDADAKAVATRRRRTAAPIVLPATAKIGNLSEARALLRERKFDSAWSATLAALDLRPFHPEAWLLLAEIAQCAGDIALARRCADRALQMVPKWKPARQLLKTLANAKANKSAVKLEFPQAGSASPKLTVCLIARNEEKFIGQCLRSVQGIAQQIVVVDTGSTDRTVEIARELGAEVYAFTWCDDFSAARNAALERARGEWVLVLDADEELLPASHAVLRSEMQCCEAIAYRLPIVDAGREEEGQSFVPRLFRNVPGLFYVSRVHEQVFASIEVRRKEWGMENRFGETRLLHHGYTLALLKSRDKIARNLRLLEKAIEDFPNDPSLLMNLGLELVRSGQFDQGIEQYIEAFEVMSAQPASEVVPELREALLTQLTTHLLGAKRHAEIARYLNSPLARNGGLTASMHFILGLAHLELKQFADGAEQMRQVLAKRNRAALTPIHKGILKAGPHHCLGLALAALQKTSEAAAAFEAALAEEPQSRGLRFDYARFLAETGQPIEALKWTHALVTEKPDELIYWQFGGHVALSQPDFIEFARDWTGEAIRQFPNHPAIARQRAEALLLNQDATESGLLWQALASTHPSALAAKLLCDFVSGDFRSRVLVSDEPLVSQHFLKWYSHLARFGANRLLHQLNENQERWRELLPAAARLLDTALLEANR